MSKQYCVDANVLITSWYTQYPPSVFPTLWEKIEDHKANIVLIKPIYDEIEFVKNTSGWTQDDWRKKAPLRHWLREKKFDITNVDAQIKNKSLSLEIQYEVADESKGVNQNDIILIAYAKEHQKTIVTFEGLQNERPKKKSNYKIPLVCQNEKVHYIEFVTMLEELGIRI